MGIYDREYYREDEAPGLLSGRSMVMNIIILNSLIFLVDALFLSKDVVGGKVGLISSTLSLKANLFLHPWNCWQLLTYGFVHSCGSIEHVLFNMLGLWFFGTDMETVYGRKEFVRIYLTLLVMSGLVWVIAHAIAVGTLASPTPLLGASGGVMGIIILYALHYPRRIINIWGVLPVQAWMLVTGYVLYDFFGAMGERTGNDRTAYSAHLAGAAFAFIYFRSGWNLGRVLPARFSLASFKLKPKLRIHDPEYDERELSRQVDRILEKIHRDGEASLTKKERKTLEEASRRYQRKRQ